MGVADQIVTSRFSSIELRNKACSLANQATIKQILSIKINLITPNQLASAPLNQATIKQVRLLLST